MTAPARTQLEVDRLIERARRGDVDARWQLMTVHRDRLRRMVEVRLDPRLSARLDASDVLQEALADAARGLDDYLRDHPLPFYPWLRQFVWERIAKQHEQHLRSQKRSVTREAAMALPGRSALELAHRLASSATSPSRRLMRDELREAVRGALSLLGPRDREVLVLRYLEGLTNGEAAAVLGVGEGAVKMRHLRALERLRALMGQDGGGHGDG